MIRVVAIIMLIMSVSGLVVSCEMDTSVPAGFGRVVNLPLAAQPQNLSLISAVLFVGGIILFATGRPMLSLPERGAAEDAALKHVIALERRLSTAVILTINEFSYMSRKNQLAIFFISIVTFPIVAILINRYASFIISPYLSYLYIKYANRRYHNMKQQQMNTILKETPRLTTNNIALALIAIYAIFGLLLFRLP
jgi:hypothetical protein